MNILTTWLTSDLHFHLLIILTSTMVSAFIGWAGLGRSTRLRGLIRVIARVIIVDSVVGALFGAPRLFADYRYLYLYLVLLVPGFIAAGVFDVLRNQAREAARAHHLVPRHGRGSEPKGGEAAEALIEKGSALGLNDADYGVWSAFDSGIEDATPADDGPL